MQTVHKLCLLRHKCASNPITDTCAFIFSYPSGTSPFIRMIFPESHIFNVHQACHDSQENPWPIFLKRTAIIRNKAHKHRKDKQTCYKKMPGTSWSVRPLLSRQTYKHVKRQMSGLCFICLLTCWDTRTRTKNDRTRICSVTITPYPNIVRFGIAYPFACAKVAIFHKPTKFFDVFLP